MFECHWLKDQKFIRFRKAVEEKFIDYVRWKLKCENSVFLNVWDRLGESASWTVRDCFGTVSGLLSFNKSFSIFFQFLNFVEFSILVDQGFCINFVSEEHPFFNSVSCTIKSNQISCCDFCQNYNEYQFEHHFRGNEFFDEFESWV